MQWCAFFFCSKNYCVGGCFHTQPDHTDLFKSLRVCVCVCVCYVCVCTGGGSSVCIAEVAALHHCITTDMCKQLCVGLQWMAFESETLVELQTCANKYTSEIHICAKHTRTCMYESILSHQLLGTYRHATWTTSHMYTQPVINPQLVSVH